MTTFADYLVGWVKRERLDLVRSDAHAAMQNEIDDRPFRKGRAKNKAITAEDLIKVARSSGRDWFLNQYASLDLKVWASQLLAQRFREVNPYEQLDLDRLDLTTDPRGLRVSGRLVGNEVGADLDTPAHISTPDVSRVLRALGQDHTTVTWVMREVAGYGYSSGLFSVYDFWGVFELPVLFVDAVLGASALRQMAEQLLARQESALAINSAASQASPA